MATYNQKVAVSKTGPHLGMLVRTANLAEAQTDVSLQGEF